MREPLIWRPNSFSQDEWNALSRDEQIQWWKSQSSPKSPISPLKLVKLFERGVITENEVCFGVIASLTHDNVREYVENSPAAVLQAVARYAETFPNDDDDVAWGQLIRIQCGTPAPWVTPEEIERARLESDRRFRNGVRILRTATAAQE